MFVLHMYLFRDPLPLPYTQKKLRPVLAAMEKSDIQGDLGV